MDPTLVTRTDTALSRLGKFPRTGAGAVRVPATIARTGVQTYGSVREYRPPESVFAADSLASLASIPVTLNHPAAGVSPANARALSIGHVTDAPPTASIKVDGDPHEWVGTTLIVQDGDALAEISARADAGDDPEISCGYTCRLEMTPGVAPDGSHYDAIQRDIRFNHVAILKKDNKARAGAGAKLRLDQENPMKIIKIDGQDFEFGSEAHLAKLDAMHKAALKAANDRADAAEGALAVEKTARAAAEAELTPAKIDARVEGRLALLRSASKYLPAKYETSGKTDADVRRDALVASGMDVTGKTDGFLEGAFAALCRQDAPAQYHKPAAGAAGAAPAARSDANDDDAFRAELAAKDKETK